MCGAYFLQQSPTLRAHFGIQSKEDLAEFVLRSDDVDPLRLFEGEDQALLQLFRPTDQVPFLARDRAGEWVGLTGTWWLAMDRDGDQWRPNQQLATFNSRIDKVVSSGRTIHSMPPRSFRVLLPASGFVEWHNKQPHLFRRADGRALMLGGMAKAYEKTNREGEDGGKQYQYAVSIVTLPGHPKTRHVHEKSVPLMLADDQIDAWLDRRRPHRDFAYLQTPQIPFELEIQAVQDLKAMAPIASPETIAADPKA
ncbi:MAG: SOS response-associated peptidase [Natronospirillum sp.]|uniref:SOS response-associated peptidase family protein n=1 Tax=Natronospirillum sp. TaxID=2812955 RepID=UPI0025CCB5E7|nr:SOS response-associated peptidase family protein [Natronospirillum sp.]MCH8550299.1 SOS response-associated peptidase [Natronospirillum sp.]